MRAMLAMLVNYIPLSEIIEYRIFTDNCAEGKGFEPLVRDRRTTVFKTVTFGRSVNLPLFDRHVDSSAYLPNDLHVEADKAAPTAEAPLSEKEKPGKR